MLLGVLEHLLEVDRARNRLDMAASDAINSTQVMVFRHVALHPGCTVGAIASGQAISQATVTKSIDRLVELGWVSRREGDIDRRMAVLTLTETGMVEWTSWSSRERVALDRMVTRMAPGELRGLLKGLRGMLGPRLVQDPEGIDAACRRCGPGCHEDCVVYQAHLALHGTPIDSP